MKLVDIVGQLPSLDREQTIYAIPPWSESSEASLASEPEADLVPKHLSALGFAYFLEVFVAQEFISDLTLSGPSSTPSQLCRRLIQYAERDA